MWNTRSFSSLLLCTLVPLFGGFESRGGFIFSYFMAILFSKKHETDLVKWKCVCLWNMIFTFFIHFFLFIVFHYVLLRHNFSMQYSNVTIIIHAARHEQHHFDTFRLLSCFQYLFSLPVRLLQSYQHVFTFRFAFQSTSWIEPYSFILNESFLLLQRTKNWVHFIGNGTKNYRKGMTCILMHFSYIVKF